ncbi:26858_t:CDS:2, partial [Gigaspora margarita]
CEILGRIYNTKKDILNVFQEIAQLSGFTVTVKSSGYHHFHIQYKHGGQPQNTSNLTVDARKRKRMSKQAKRIAEQMLKAGAKPSTIYEAIRDENGEPTMTRRDILNLSSQIYISEENSSMEALIIGIKKRGYTVRRETQKVKAAKRFPEVILANATYKMNVYKLLFVNFVDNDAALIGALKKTFPQSEHLLCTWHVLNNFKKNLKKHFMDDSFDKIIKTVDRIIHLSDYEMLNLTITLYKTLAALSFNE